MRKVLKAVPLTVSIASLILFIYNKIIIKVRNIIITEEIVKTLNIYLTISVFSFILYLVVRLISYILEEKDEEVYFDENYKNNPVISVYSVINVIKLIMVIAAVIFLGYKIYQYRMNIPYLY